MAKQETSSNDKYVLKEIPTAFDFAIGEKDSEDVFTEKGLLLEILNKLDRIEKAVGA